MKKAGFVTRASAKEARKNKRRARTDVDEATVAKIGVSAVKHMNRDALSPGMPSSGSDEPLIWCIGDAPGFRDDANGESWSGSAGDELKRALGNYRRYVRYDNVCRTLPPKGRGPLRKEIAAFQTAVFEDIEKHQPRVVLGLGKEPLKSFTSLDNIFAARGKSYPIKVGSHECWFIPTVHPNYLARIEGSRDRKVPSKEWDRFWLMDVEKAIALAESDSVPKVVTPEEAWGDITHCFTIDLVEQAVAELAGGPLGLDVENHRLRPYWDDSKLLSVALSDGQRSWAIPIDHPSAKWTAHQKSEIRQLLCSLFKDPGTEVIAHHAPHDLEWMYWFCGRDALLANWGCSLSAAFVLNPGPPGDGSAGLRLNDLCIERFGLDLKSLTPGSENVTRLRELPIKDVLNYNALDAQWALSLFESLWEDIEGEPCEHGYRAQTDRIPAIVAWQVQGVPIDEDERLKLKKDVEGQMREVVHDIRDNEDVSRWQRRTREVFSPTKTEQVGRLLYQGLGIEEVKTAKGFSSAKGVLEPLRKKHEVVDLILRHRELSKMMGTYVTRFDPEHPETYVYPDGKIHCSFTITRARTGRLACVAAWTPVKTPTGTKAISDVQVGDLVWTHKHRWKPVTRTIFKGFEQMYDVHLSNGSVLTCTTDHRFLAYGSDWVTLRSIINGGIEADRERPGQVEADRGPLPVPGPSDHPGLSQASWNHASHGQLRSQERPRLGDLQGSQGVPILTLESGRPEPEQGQDPREVSPLEGALSGRVRVHHGVGHGWQTEVQAPNRDGSGFGPENSAAQVSCAPHRRGPDQQRSGQPRSLHSESSRSYPRLAAGHGYVEIEAIVPRTRLGVYDLTVADDHSYEACGVQNHNSEDPNNQNWPKRKNKHVRRQLKAPPGWIFVAVDQGQIEARVLAMESCDPVWVRMIEEGYDVHQEWAEKIARIEPQFARLLKSDPKKARHRSKNEWVFPSFFGSSYNSISENLKITNEKRGLALFEEFWDIFQGVKQWQQGQWEKYQEDGLVRTLTGRQRLGPLSWNMVINTPIQGTASDICVDAGVRCWRRSVRESAPFLCPVLQIHDDLTFLMPESEAAYGIEAVVEEQLGFKAPWVNVPLSVEVEVGENLCDMEEIGTWTSYDLGLMEKTLN